MKQNRTKKIAIIFLLNAIEVNINLRYTNDDDEEKNHKINVVFVNFCILMKNEHSKNKYYYILY